MAAVVPTQLQGPHTPPSTTATSTLIVNRVSLPADPIHPDTIQRVLNGKSGGGDALRMGPANSGDGQLAKTSQNETRVLDDARKRLLAKNNVSIFQKSKGAAALGEKIVHGQEAAASTVAKTAPRDWKECLEAQGLVASARSATGFPLKIPRPALSRPSNPFGGVRPYLADGRPLGPAGSQPGNLTGHRPITGQPLNSGVLLSGEEGGATPSGQLERIAAPSGHPGLPSGLMHMASSVIPASKSPTKITPRAEVKLVAGHTESFEVRRARLDLLFQPPTPVTPSSTGGRGGESCLEDPPILTPQVIWEPTGTQGSD